MSDFKIKIKKTHDIGLDGARSIIEKYAGDLSAQGISWGWSDDKKNVIILNGVNGHVKGAQGVLMLTEDSVTAILDLQGIGFMQKAGLKALGGVPMLQKKLEDGLEEKITEYKARP